MKTVLMAVALTFVASEASAISHYQTMRMSCDRIQNVVQSEGAVILRWQSKRVSNLPLYGRYVANHLYCHTSEKTKVVSVPSADTSDCVVKQCTPKEGRRRPWLFGN